MKKLHDAGIANSTISDSTLSPTKSLIELRKKMHEDGMHVAAYVSIPMWVPTMTALRMAEF